MKYIILLLSVISFFSHSESTSSVEKSEIFKQAYSIFETGKDDDEAMRLFQKAYKNDNSQYHALALIGVTLQYQSKHEEAISYFKQAIDYDARARYFYSLYVSYGHLNQNKKSEEAFLTAISIDPLDSYVAKERIRRLRNSYKTQSVSNQTKIMKIAKDSADKHGDESMLLRVAKMAENQSLHVLAEEYYRKAYSKNNLNKSSAISAIQNADAMGRPANDLINLLKLKFPISSTVRGRIKTKNGTIHVIDKFSGSIKFVLINSSCSGVPLDGHHYVKIINNKSVAEIHHTTNNSFVHKINLEANIDIYGVVKKYLQETSIPCK
jgi:tetratricopeptide (TPR) repeat protein